MARDEAGLTLELRITRDVQGEYGGIFRSVGPGALAAELKIVGV